MALMVLLGLVVLGMIVFNIMYEMSVRNLGEKLPQAETKILRAMLKIEYIQAEKLVKNQEYNDRK